jgi:hypothetical protein
MAAIFQNTVVDILATSRYGAKADTAVISSTILLQDRVDPDEYAEHGDVETALDGRMVLIRNTVEIPERDGVYHVAFSSPSGPQELMKNGDYSLIVLLPRPGFHPVGPLFDVELVNYSLERKPKVFGGDALPGIGNRIAVAWSARQDPEDTLDYIYHQVMGDAGP